MCTVAGARSGGVARRATYRERGAGGSVAGVGWIGNRPDAFAEACTC